MTPLSAAIGHYRHSEALFADPLLAIEDFPVISRAFAPMVRSQRFALSEMAIATFLMARAAGSDLVLLPAVMAARFQNAALLRRAADPFGPADLAGKRVGVRAYSQTTCMWLRGDLQETTGLTPDRIRWTTFEDAHVAGFQDPPWTERAPPGSDMMDMLREGRLDAVIVGNDMPDDPSLAPVWPDPVAAGAAFHARHGFMPVNHLLVLRPLRPRRAGPRPRGRQPVSDGPRGAGSARRPGAGLLRGAGAADAKGDDGRGVGGVAGGGRVRKEAVLFLKKKKQKDFHPFGAYMRRRLGNDPR